MKTKQTSTTSTTIVAKTKAYRTPKLTVLGSVTKLTLKVGSDSDMMGPGFPDGGGGDD